MIVGKNSWVVYSKIIEAEYEIKAKCTTTANTQESLIIEKSNKFIENLVHMFDLKNN